ncbi:hypothetical protein GCM10018783_56770 [Streptomyces griseosporeus]|nr:hypothetical protein GCM10018783_56770 [Streptomyces griseosporeus]
MPVTEVVSVVWASGSKAREDPLPVVPCVEESGPLDARAVTATPPTAATPAPAPMPITTDLRLTALCRTLIASPCVGFRGFSGGLRLRT